MEEDEEETDKTPDSTSVPCELFLEIMRLVSTRSPNPPVCREKDSGRDLLPLDAVTLVPCRRVHLNNILEEAEIHVGGAVLDFEVVGLPVEPGDPAPVAMPNPRMSFLPS